MFYRVISDVEFGEMVMVIDELEKVIEFFFVELVIFL